MASYKESYSKRPLWQWILIYLVIGGIIYLVVYFLFIKKGGGYSPVSAPVTSSAPSVTTNPTNAPVVTNAPIYRVPGY